MKKYKTRKPQLSMTRDWLRQYHKLQEHIVVVYHPQPDSSWAERGTYLLDNYSQTLPYNHRSMLTNELVIEHDDENPKNNERYAKTISERLTNDNIKHAVWFSGGKSTHIHLLINLDNVANKRLFKRVFMRHYCDDLPLPDLQLCTDNHLIRAEHGVHEKTQKRKSLLSRSPGYPCYSEAPQVVWDKYTSEYQRVLNRKLTMDVNEVADSKLVAHLINTNKFRSYDDGRERALFILTHVLKPKYPGDKQGLTKFLQDWYKYSGGRKLSSRDIANKVRYHWSRSYFIGEAYILDFLEEIGCETKDL